VRKIRRKEQSRTAQRALRKKKASIVVYVSKSLKKWLLRIARGYNGGQAGYVRDLIERDKKAREGRSQNKAWPSD
jgi:hypothetical protein